MYQQKVRRNHLDEIYRSSVQARHGIRSSKKLERPLQSTGLSKYGWFTDITMASDTDKCSLSYGFHGLAPLGEDLFASTLPHLKLITNSGAGTDILDIDWFTKNGVYVANTPTAVTKATADGTALMILSAIKNTTAVMAQAKSTGPWREGLDLMGDPEEMTLGIM